MDDDVFRALADPNRRTLLDRLVEQDGQTSGQLEASLPTLSRFAVMNHLRVLEHAQLLTTRRAGRYKYHYLNPVPIQRVADRWISKYAAPFTKAISHLKTTLEQPTMTAPTKPRHVYTAIIQATPDDIWRGLTAGDMTAQYYFGGAVASTWKPGDPFSYTYPDGTIALEGDVIEADPPRRLVTTYRACWAPDVAEDPPSQVTYEIEPMGPVTRLTVIHDGFDIENATYRQIGEGLPIVISGLKTLLETGTPLPVN